MVLVQRPADLKDPVGPSRPSQLKGQCVNSSLKFGCWLKSSSHSLNERTNPAISNMTTWCRCLRLEEKKETQHLIFNEQRLEPRDRQRDARDPTESSPSLFQKQSHCTSFIEETDKSGNSPLKKMYKLYFYFFNLFFLQKDLFKLKRVILAALTLPFSAQSGVPSLKSRQRRRQATLKFTAQLRRQPGELTSEEPRASADQVHTQSGGRGER